MTSLGRLRWRCVWGERLRWVIWEREERWREVRSREFTRAVVQVTLYSRHVRCCCQRSAMNVIAWPAMMYDDNRLYNPYKTPEQLKTPSTFLRNSTLVVRNVNKNSTNSHDVKTLTSGGTNHHCSIWLHYIIHLLPCHLVNMACPARMSQDKFKFRSWWIILSV